MDSCVSLLWLWVPSLVFFVSSERGEGLLGTGDGHGDFGAATATTPELSPLWGPSGCGGGDPSKLPWITELGL